MQVLVDVLMCVSVSVWGLGKRNNQNQGDFSGKYQSSEGPSDLRVSDGMVDP